MAMQVIDRLETIQIDGQNREGFPAALRHRQFAQYQFVEQHPIAQAGQRIVMRQVLGMRQHAGRLHQGSAHFRDFLDARTRHRDRMPLA